MKIKLTNCGALLLVVLLIVTEQAKGQGAPVNMSWIPAGSFQMGDTFNDTKFGEELPLHTVYVSSFYIDKYEVTKALWDEVYQWAIVNGYSFDHIGSGKAVTHPVQTVSWYDVVKWCNARSEKEGRVPAYYTNLAQTIIYRFGQVDVQNDWVKWNIGYRLPTEAEWEKAARGGVSEHRFPWSGTDSIAHSRANYYSSSYGNRYDVSSTRGYHPTFNDGVIPYTSPVGYFTPNGYDLYDMAGNVFEWCWDFAVTYSADSQIDPRGPTSGWLRKVRGGSYYFSALDCRSAGRRVDYDPTYGLDTLGFRSVFPMSLPYETTEILNTPLTQETYQCSITRQSGKDSLVIVTHGWIPKKDSDTVPPNPDWVDGMINLIQNYITSHNLGNWQVEAFKWKEKAWIKLPTDQLLDNGEKEGGNLGDYVGSQGWSHIHLIGHSAGAAVIQTATLNIKSKNINTVVHTTFLDPYVGFTYGGKSRYGLVADWADNYFAWDPTTYDHLFFGRTASKLDHAYNIDVGWLDPNKVSLGRYRSTATGGIEECFETVTSHEWPHNFYINTIIPNAQTGSQGFGFPLSKEGGNLNFARANYSTYTDPTRVLGTPDESCPLMPNYSIPVYPSWLMNFNQTPSVASTTGSIENHGSFFILSSTGSSQLRQSKTLTKNVSDVLSPAWLATVLSVTNKINSVSFETEFSSETGAEGILSIYWNTNLLGTIDERVVVPGLRYFTYSLSQTVTNGTYTLGFRLDSFTAITSSATVTNVALSFVGILDPFSLYFVGKDASGFNLFKLIGPSGFNYSVEASTNLIDWQTMAVLVNTNGTVPFVDRQSSNSTTRFYRAVGY